MKKLLPLLLACLAAASCARNPQHARYAEEKNAPRAEKSRTYVESPAVVKIAARAVLDELNRESDPAVTGSLKGNDEIIRTGWVYGTSKSKYVEYRENGKPRRKPLRVRRIYGYAITPSLSGTNVSLEVEEETMALDLATGEEKGWRGASPDPAAYELLGRRLTEKMRQR